jgi:hypothetical protein
MRGGRWGSVFVRAPFVFDDAYRDARTQCVAGPTPWPHGRPIAWATSTAMPPYRPTAGGRRIAACKCARMNPSTFRNGSRCTSLAPAPSPRPPRPRFHRWRNVLHAAARSTCLRTRSRRLPSSRRTSRRSPTPDPPARSVQVRPSSDGTRRDLSGFHGPIRRVFSLFSRRFGNPRD